MSDEFVPKLQQQAINEAMAKQEYLAWMWAAKRAGWDGTKAWMRAQAKEEGKHSYKVQHFIDQFFCVQGFAIAVDEVAKTFSTHDATFREILALEQLNLAQWTELSIEAQAAGRADIEAFCHDFIVGQLESIQELNEILTNLPTYAGQLRKFESWIKP